MWEVDGLMDGNLLVIGSGFVSALREESIEWLW